jgi:hypothetical protein
MICLHFLEFCRDFNCIILKVIRTLNRPLASGELRMRHAALWLLFQLSLAFSILLQLNYPCFLIGVGSLGIYKNIKYIILLNG